MVPASSALGIIALLLLFVRKINFALLHVSHRKFFPSSSSKQMPVNVYLAGLFHVPRPPPLLAMLAVLSTVHLPGQTGLGSAAAAHGVSSGVGSVGAVAREAVRGGVVGSGAIGGTGGIARYAFRTGRTVAYRTIRAKIQGKDNLSLLGRLQKTMRQAKQTNDVDPSLDITAHLDDVRTASHFTKLRGGILEVASLGAAERFTLLGGLLRLRHAASITRKLTKKELRTLGLSHATDLSRTLQTVDDYVASIVMEGALRAQTGGAFMDTKSWAALASRLRAIDLVGLRAVTLTITEAVLESITHIAAKTIVRVGKTTNIKLLPGIYVDMMKSLRKLPPGAEVRDNFYLC